MIYCMDKVMTCGNRNPQDHFYIFLFVYFKVLHIPIYNELRNLFLQKKTFRKDFEVVMSHTRKNKRRYTVSFVVDL